MSTNEVADTDQGAELADNMTPTTDTPLKSSPHPPTDKQDKHLHLDLKITDNSTDTASNGTGQGDGVKGEGQSPGLESGSRSELSNGPKDLHPSDMEVLAKMEEANRQIELSPSSITTTNPTQLELLARLEQANRLLEADKRKCKGLTPTHSRTGSTAGSVGGHVRNNSSTSQISVTSNNSQVTVDEESGHGNLWEIWGKLVNDWASAKKKPTFIKQLVRKGIPHPFRGLAWQLLLDVYNSPMKEMYVEYLKQKSPSEKMIRRDIARTFPEHDFFKEKDGLGQESLFNVMKAYSLHDREVGYCQGSGFIVGLLLMQMPEEETFAVLVKLMQDYRLRELFTPSMAELGLCMYKLECLIQEILPDLYTHFQTQSFHTSMYASPWFLTLFTTVVPINVAARIMDLFISEGMDVIFRIGIAILQSSQHELLSQDMEAMLQFFQKDIAAKFEREEEDLFRMTHQVRFSAKKLKRLEKEYTALKSKENEDQIELRRLRTENRLLRQRIDNLEKESANLADRLIHYQLTRAQEAEETYALKNELSLTKQKFTTSQKQLKEAESLIGDIKERTDSIHSASSLDEGEAQTVITGLQEELIVVRLREAENTTVIKNLKMKIHELEQTNIRLQQAPSNDIQCLQEELIAVKLREAEANLSLKEMRQTISDLETNWQRHLSMSDSGVSPKDKGNSKSELKAEVKKAQEELMSSKLKEAGALSHLKDAKQKIMELETSNQICTNQIRRMDEENKSYKSEIDNQQKAWDESQKQIKALLRKIDDLESKHREELMMARIREAENDQVIGEFKQKIAQMEIQKEELLAADSLENKGGKQDLQNTIYDLQEEVMQLKMSASPKSPNTSASSVNSRTSVKQDEFDDYNDDDDDDIEDPESLNRTLSEIIEGKRSSSSLIAILNRENSDGDTSSIKSSGSENSNCGHTKLVKTNSFKGVKIVERDSEDCDSVTSDVTGSKDVTGNGKSDTADGNSDSSSNLVSQDKSSAINQSSMDKNDTQSIAKGGHSTQSIEKGGNSSNSAMQENQSVKNDSGDLNGMDANDNLHSKGASVEVREQTAEQTT